MDSKLQNLSSLPPQFITFEGGEGVGKSTQISLFKQALEAQNVKVYQTREPGGCPQAEILRSLLVEGDDSRWDGLSEALLYSAARHEHMRTTVRPALEKGQWVISDRFVDSTTVYQGEGRGIERGELLNLHNLAIGKTWPNLTFILDIDVEEGLKRTQTRTGSAHENRFENLDVSFHKRVRNGFLKIARENPQRCHIINASGTESEVHKRIMVTFLNNFNIK